MIRRRFSSRLVALDGKKIDRLTIGDKGSADAAKAVVEAGRFTVASTETKPFTRNPPPPFTTSTLQQEASRKLGYSASHTMRLAQSLYEDGLITYMRTDGVQMADEAISAARRAIADRYDAGYVPDKPRVYSSKAKNAQEAHEAIRVTDFTKDRAGSGDHAKLYALIFNRALASQMASARLERTTVELTDGAGRATLRATGQVVLFPGYLALYEEGRDEKADDEESARMPLLKAGDAPAKKGVEATQSFTQPPPRYSEASLVKRMEELGIGRPSTYAATLQTLEGPRICPDRQEPLHPRGERAAGDGVPRALLRTLCRLRLYREPRGRARRRVGRAHRLAAIARGVLEGLQAQGRRSDGAEAVRRDRGARRIPRAVAVPRAKPTAAIRASARRAAPGGWRCAAASSAASSPAPIIPSANIRRSSGRAATPRWPMGRPNLARA